MFPDSRSVRSFEIPLCLQQELKEVMRAAFGLPEEEMNIFGLASDISTGHRFSSSDQLTCSVSSASVAICPTFKLQTLLRYKVTCMHSHPS